MAGVLGFFKEAAFELTKPLTVLFQKFLDSGEIPNTWKTTNFVPVFKKGDQKLPSNHRPNHFNSCDM